MELSCSGGSDGMGFSSVGGAGDGMGLSRILHNFVYSSRLHKLIWILHT